MGSEDSVGTDGCCHLGADKVDNRVVGIVGNWEVGPVHLGEANRAVGAGDRDRTGTISLDVAAWRMEAVSWLV